MLCLCILFLLYVVFIENILTRDYIGLAIRVYNVFDAQFTCLEVEPDKIFNRLVITAFYYVAYSVVQSLRTGKRLF